MYKTVQVNKIPFMTKGNTFNCNNTFFFFMKGYYIHIPNKSTKNKKKERERVNKEKTRKKER